MKKLSVLLSILILFSLVLAACAKTTTPPAEEPVVEKPVEEPVVEEPVVEEPVVEEPVVEEPVVEEPVVEEAPPFEGVTIQFWHVYSDAPGDALQALVDEFNAGNPYGIVVDSLDQGSYSDIEDKVNAGIQSGDLPDVVMAYTNALADWYSVGFVADLNPYINDAEYGLTAEQQADLYPHLREAGSTPDGAWIAYPMTQSANVLVYNFTWAEELGFSEPPTTSRELKDLVCAAAADNAAIGGDFAGTGGIVYFPTPLTGCTCCMRLEARNSMLLVMPMTSTPGSNRYLHVSFDLKRGCAWQTESYPNPEQGQRRAIITMSSTAGAPYYEAAFEEANNDDIWGWIAAPADGTLAVNAFQQMLGVIPSTQQREMASWLFVKWLTSPEIQARWIPASGYYGTQYSTEALLADYAQANPVWESGVRLAAIGPSEPQTFPAWSSVRRAINNFAAELYNATSQAEVEEILARLTETANDLVKEVSQ